MTFISIAAIAVGCGMIISALVLGIQGLAGATPVAALVLHRNENRGVVMVHLLLVNDRRKYYVAVGRAAMSAYPGEIGWAFVAGGMLLGFERGPQRQP